MDYIKYAISGSKQYKLNFHKLTCTCENFKYTRSKIDDLTDPERCCKHLKKWLLSNQGEIKEMLIAGCQIPPMYIPLNLVHLLNVKTKPKFPYEKIITIINNRIQPIFDKFIDNGTVLKYNYAGSLRRKLDLDIIPDNTTVGDIDIIYTGSMSINDIVDLIKPEHRKTVGSIHQMMLIEDVHTDIIKIEKEHQYPFTLLRLTGSKGENIRLSSIANSKGLLLNQYGLYHLKNGEHVDFIFKTENDIYAFLGEPYKRPSLRSSQFLPPETLYNKHQIISKVEISKIIRI